MSRPHKYPRVVIDSAKANGWEIELKKNGHVCFRHKSGAVVWGSRKVDSGAPLENLLSRLRQRS